MINGGVKFFHGAKNLYRDRTAITASTNDGAAKFILDYNKHTLWESIGSNDITQETIEIELLTPQKINRLFIINHNLKKYNIKYWNGSAYVNFTNAIGMNGEVKGSITETTYSRSSSYYEFDEITTDAIYITMDATQIANQDKEIYGLYITEEIGTFEGFPRISRIKHDRSLRVAKALSGKAIVQKSYEVTEFSISFKTYPLQSDIDIVNTVHEIEETFLVWLCGGRVGTNYFRLVNRGYRPEDLYNMQIDKAISTDYEKGIYTNGINTSISLVEAV